MALNQPIRYGDRRYSLDTISVLYSCSFIPQALTLSLTEVVAQSDADILSAAKALADALGLTDTERVAIAKALSDAVTSTDALVKSAALAFLDSLSFGDTRVATIYKSLREHIVFTEWLQTELAKQFIWVDPSQNKNIWDSLYAKGNNGPVVYGGKDVLYGGLKPAGSWSQDGVKQGDWSY